MHDKKRRSLRSVKRMTVRYGTEKADKLGYSKNVSAVGMFISTRSPLPVGTVIQMEVEVAGRSYPLRGTVVWIKRAPAHLAHVMDTGMGIDLIAPSVDFLKACGAV